MPGQHTTLKQNDNTEREHTLQGIRGNTVNLAELPSWRQQDGGAELSLSVMKIQDQAAASGNQQRASKSLMLTSATGTPLCSPVGT